MTSAAVLLAIRHKQVTGELTGDEGIKLLIAWNAIQNRHAIQRAYEDHLRSFAQAALSGVGQSSAHYDLDSVAADILAALDLQPQRA
jgi:hypothetical protein